MRKQTAAFMVMIGIVIMAVPFFIRVKDIKRAEDYIEQIGVTEDVEKAKEEQERTGNRKKEAAEELPEGVIGIIEIESLNLRYPVFEGTGDAQLDEGIGHLTETAGLCEKGNCVLAGHNGSFRGMFFTRLSEIEAGAEVEVTNRNGVTHTYVVEKLAVVGAYDTSVREESGEERLTLLTCAYHGTQRFVCICRLSSGSDGQPDRE